MNRTGTSCLGIYSWEQIEHLHGGCVTSF